MFAQFFFVDSTEMAPGKEDGNKRPVRSQREEAIANIPVAILTSECGLPNALLCSFAGCMRWASRFGSQMFLSSCLDSLEAISEAYVAFVMCSFVWNCF